MALQPSSDMPLSGAPVSNVEQAERLLGHLSPFEVDCFMARCARHACEALLALHTKRDMPVFKAG